jgi:hypothetical protein
MTTLAERFPEGLVYSNVYGHNAIRQGVDSRSRQDAARGYGIGVPGGVPVLAELARHSDPVRSAVPVVTYRDLR